MTLIPGLTFTELRVVFMEHLQRVWHASRERLPLRTPGSVPYFGACICSGCRDHFSGIYTNVMTLIPKLTFTELREVSIEHLRRRWHASRECLPFRTPGFAPFKDSLMLQQLVRPIFRADRKTWHLYWRHFLVLWNSWGTELDETWQEASTQTFSTYYVFWSR